CNMHAWIRQSLAENKPYDRFVAEILGAKGDASTNPPVALYRPQTRQNKDELVDDSAQLFLGLRIQCARCHHHPFEKWSQDDYYGFAAFFARVGRKPSLDGIQEEQRIFANRSGEINHPKTGQAMKPRGLDGPELDGASDE